MNLANLKKDALIILLALLFAALYTGGICLLGYHWGHSGVVVVQAAWDKQKAADQLAAQKALSAQQSKTQSLQAQFDKLSGQYSELQAKQTPSIADSIPASISAGTLVLRDQAPACPRSNGVTQSTADSRAADAAATQALADRVSNSISAVRAGDAADKREQQLDAQIVGLQAALDAIQKAYGSAQDGKH